MEWVIGVCIVAMVAYAFWRLCREYQDLDD